MIGFNSDVSDFVFDGVLFDDPRSIYNGYLAILQSPSILISDYLEIGSLGRRF